jgi:nucleoside-triphosphatase
MRNKILLTGEPRVGKTTALKKIIQRIGETNCIGFYTEEIRNEFDRIGFDCVSLDGRRARIADINFKSDIRMGRYGIDIEAFEDIALKAINTSLSSNKVIIIDEIGPIQLLSTKFKQEIYNILASPNWVVGTIFYNKHPDADEIKKAPGIKLFRVTSECRDIIIEDIFHDIQGLV